MMIVKIYLSEEFIVVQHLSSLLWWDLRSSGFMSSHNNRLERVEYFVCKNRAIHLKECFRFCKRQTDLNQVNYFILPLWCWKYSSCPFVMLISFLLVLQLNDRTVDAVSSREGTTISRLISNQISNRKYVNYRSPIYPKYFADIREGNAFRCVCPSVHRLEVVGYILSRSCLGGLVGHLVRVPTPSPTKVWIWGKEAVTIKVAIKDCRVP